MVPSRFAVRRLLVLMFSSLVLFSWGFYIDHSNFRLASKSHSLQHGVTSLLDNIFKRTDDDGDVGYNSPPCPNSCAPRVDFVDATSRRSLQELGLRDVNTSALEERQMTLPGADMDSFMVGEVPRAKLIVWRLPNDNDVNTSIYRPLRRLAVSLGTYGLCGCSSLWIISRTGVYASHWWESISFSPDDIWLHEGETDDAIFKRTVIDPLSTGAEASSQTRLIAADFDENSIRAYLVHPNTDCHGNQDGYRARWNEVKEEVGNIIPSLNPGTFPDRWVEPIYARLNPDDDALYDTAAGHVLFKYDNDHNGRKKAVLWVEGNPMPLHDDEW